MPDELDLVKTLSGSGDSSSSTQPFLGQVVELCLVTPDLRKTLAGLAKLGIGPFKIFRFNSHTVKEMTYKGEAAEFEIEVAFAEQGAMIWEVMQPVSGPSIMADFLKQTGGKGGLQHICFDCTEGMSGLANWRMKTEKAREEAVRRREEFGKRGFPVVQSGVWHGKKGTCEFMFFDTESTVGLCFESYVFSDDWEEPEDAQVYPEKRPKLFKSLSMMGQMSDI